MEKNNIEILINLHKLDKKLYEIDNKRRNFPEKIEEANNKIDLLNENNSENELRKSKIEKRKNEINNNVTDFNTKIESLNNQMYKVKSNKEYDALLLEIDHLNNKLTEEKNEIINFDNELEILSDSIGKNNEDLESNSAILSELKSKLDNANSEIINEEKTLTSDKNNILNQLAEEEVNFYNDKKEEYGLAFAAVSRKSCSNCFSSLPPQVFINIVERNKLQGCPSCNIFLYIDEENIDL